MAKPFEGRLAERRSLGCALAGVPIFPSRFLNDLAGCTGGPTIGCLPGRWRRRSARPICWLTICIGAVQAFCAVRMSLPRRHNATTRRSARFLPNPRRHIWLHVTFENSNRRPPEVGQRPHPESTMTPRSGMGAPSAGALRMRPLQPDSNQNSHPTGVYRHVGAKPH
jgi:hypothetical protein